MRSDADLLGMIAFNFACFGGTPHDNELSKQARSPGTTAGQWVIDGLPDRW